VKRKELVQLAHVRELARDGTARAIRIAAGLSLGEIADHVGVGIGTVSRWETGERRPHGKRALRYAELLEALQEREKEAVS
jgi:transcriptional regulator with XRE-family HTH domain